jgi:hypothetical protein
MRVEKGRPSSPHLSSKSVLPFLLRTVDRLLLKFGRSRSICSNTCKGCLARFGLTCWCPDLRQTPYALYNAACRIIALDTFKQALVSHTYAHLKPNTTYAKDMGLLICLYDHVVHHYMYLRYKQDSRNPGSVEAADKASPQYRGRARVGILYIQCIGTDMTFILSLLLLVSRFSSRITTHSVIVILLMLKQHPMMSQTHQVVW